MKTIRLTQGKFALIDDADWALVSQYRWHASYSKKRWTARTATSMRTHGERKTLYMHVLIMRPPAGKIVDHQDHDGLNNQRSNLRVTTQQMNCVNRIARGASGYHGVSKRGKSWQVGIGKNAALFRATCQTAIEAAQLYDAKAREIYGEYAYLNFPTMGGD